MNADDCSLRPARGEDLEAVVALLAACALPSSDLSPASLTHFHVIESAGRLAGVAGLEVADSFGLLRSVVVAPALRGQGLAERLVEAIEASANTAGLSALYLLANDANAAHYFGDMGYTSVERARVPMALLALPEFSQLCPQSCPCLRKVLDSSSFREPETGVQNVGGPATFCPDAAVSSCCKQ